jgi:hypothetical protein
LNLYENNNFKNRKVASEFELFPLSGAGQFAPFDHTGCPADRNKKSPADAQNAQVALILLGCEELTDMTVLEKNETARKEYALKKDFQAQQWKGASHPLLETDPHFFLHGCYLAQEKGPEAALAYLTNISERAFPPTPMLLSHYLIGRINLKKGWIESAFFWEKLKLMQQLELFSRSLGDEGLKKLAKTIQKKL